VAQDKEPIRDDGLEPSRERSNTSGESSSIDNPAYMDFDVDYEGDLEDFRDQFGYDPATGDMNDSAYEPYYAEDYGPESEDGLTADSPVIEMGGDVIEEGYAESHGGKFKRAYERDLGKSKGVVDHIARADGFVKTGIDKAVRLLGFAHSGEFTSLASPYTYYNTSGGGAYSLEDLYNIDQASKASGVPREVIAAIGLIETGNVPMMSMVGAAGPFQHMDTTARPAGGLVGYREGEVEYKGDGSYVINRDGTEVVIGRYGDYQDVENEDIYYPFEDGRYGTESFFGTGRIAGAKFNSRNIRTWFEAALKYNGGPGYKVPEGFGNAADNYGGLVSYIISGPYPGESAKFWKGTLSEAKRKEKERRIRIQEASKESRKYALKFAFALRGASRIDWKVLDDYTPEYEEVKVPDEEESDEVSLAELTKGGFGVDRLYQNGWNAEYQFLRVPFPKDVAFKLPESGKRYGEKLGVIFSVFLGDKERTPEEIEKLGEPNIVYREHLAKPVRLQSRVIDEGTFERPEEDAPFAVVDEDDGLVILHVDRYARGMRPPTIQDLIMCGIDPVEFIELNRHYFGGRDKKGVYHEPHPEWKRHMENTYLRPGSFLKVNRNNIGDFGILLETASDPGIDASEIEDVTISEEERPILQRADYNLENFCIERMFAASTTRSDMSRILDEGADRYESVDKPWHAEYARDRWHRDYEGHTEQTVNRPIARLLRVSEEALGVKFESNDTVSLYELISSDPTLTLRWLDEFFYPHVSRMLIHRREMTAREIKFFITATKLYARIAKDNKFIFPERFWDQYKIIKDAYYEILFYEDDKHKKYVKLMDTMDPSKSSIDHEAFRKERRKLLGKGRSPEDWEGIRELLMNNEDLDEDLNNYNVQRTLQEAEKKIGIETEKFEQYGIYSKEAEVVDIGGLNVVRVPIYIETAEYPIAYVEFDAPFTSEDMWKFKLPRTFSLFYMDGADPNASFFSKASQEDISNAGLVRLEHKHMLDPLFAHVLWEGVNKGNAEQSVMPEGVFATGGRNNHLLFTTYDNRSAHTVLVNPLGADYMDAEGALRSDELIGNFYVDLLDRDGNMDGNFITLLTFEWELYTDEAGVQYVGRKLDTDGNMLPSKVLGRFNNVEDLIAFIQETDDFIRQPKLDE
jgi:hypothetical protein